METSTTLPSASQLMNKSIGPVLRVKLLPIRKLARLTLQTIKSELRINQYLGLYTALFAAMGAGILVSILVFI